MRNIIITGGELYNKGAQAMTFAAVDEIKKRFPQHQIYLLSEMDLTRPESERRRYAFDFIGWYPRKFAKCQKNVFLRLLCMLRSKTELLEAESIYGSCDAMVDVSGYALGSYWGRQSNERYLDHLEFAQAFGIPVYLMPQSFGPFDFANTHPDIDARCRRLLPGVKMILAREQEGCDALVNTYLLRNVKLAPDLVLNNKGIDLKNVFRDMPVFSLPDILPGSIAVIPNGRNLSTGHEADVLNLYEASIRHALNMGKRVYLLYHATSDAQICTELKARFETEERVIFLDQEFSCLEYNELVGRFDYLVASRYHSIVHAYKNKVPCVVLGWATKYHDLLAQFSQTPYMFDVRETFAHEELIEAMTRMEERYAAESERIGGILADVQRENVFDILSKIQ